MIYGAVKEQKLVIRADAVADTIDYLTAKFSFMSQDWEGLTVYAHFTQGKTSYSVQLVDGMITESDHLNLGKGEWEVYLHGNEYKNGEVIKRITTNICTFTVLPTGILNGDPFPEAEPSVVEQLAAQVEDHEERIDTVEDIIDTEVKGLSIGSGALMIATGQEIYDTYYHTGTTNLFNGPYRILRMRIDQQEDLLKFWGIRRITDVSTTRIDITEFAVPLDGKTARRVGVTHAIPTYEEYEKLVGITTGEISEGNEGYVIGGDVFTALSGKQDTLTAGENITIENNVISSTGGASVQSDYAQTDSDAPDYIKNKPDLSVYAESADLSAVATSGDYTDLSNAPDLSVYAQSSDLATVATSGAYSDLSGTPSLANVATSGDYDDLTNKPTIPAAQIQSDYGQTNSSAVDYIKNKPDLSIYAQSSSLASVATSGSYADLSNTPTIPSAGQIASGDTGYVTGGDAYTALSGKQDTLTAGQNITISNNVISASGGGFVAQSSAPSDTSVLWVDTDDNTIDETLANADTSSY